MNKKKDWMQRAFDLAQLGAGKVAPNPLVGCVIVKENQIIGEGWHQHYGGPHAEVESLHSIPKELTAQGATVYVTLEPCSHFGKTPPCADLLIQHQIKKISISNLDPNNLVAGKGIKKLEAAGIEIEIGLLSDIGEKINRKFFTFHRKKRPYITVKYACSADNFISKKNGEAVQFSNVLSKKFVHKLRSEHQAILIGTNTAILDNPSLTTRFWHGESPIRIVLDPNEHLKKELTILTDDLPCLVFTKSFNQQINNKQWIAIGNYIGPEFIKIAIERCYELGIQSILVEGGSKTIQYFHEAKLIDELYRIEAKINLIEGIKAPDFHVQYTESKQIGLDNYIKHAQISAY
jgi:diaminohydroxyphosphoribosylaminopyrimidine deaminase/5-amino-6-(5-phosphoribosylamino)uracil reductase